MRILKRSQGSGGCGGNRVPRLPTTDELRSAVDSLRLNHPEWEVFRFVYEKHRDGNPAAGAIIDVTLRHEMMGEQAHYRFSGVVLEYFPPLHSPFPIMVLNAGRRGWEVPRDLRVSVSEDHPDSGTIFWAADVQRVV